MAYIHEHSGWPSLKWDETALAALLGRVRHSQGRLLGKMEGLGFSLRNEASLRMLTADVVKSSAIEGEQLDAEAVRSSLARRLGLDIGGLKPAPRDVEGIVEMMLDATQHYDRPLTAERLFDWHAALFPTGRTGMRKITVGAWRTAASGPMQVVSGAAGKEKIHFEAPGSERLAKEMKSFLKWIEKPSPVDPVLQSGVAHFWFVTIHPFEDGNGRIGRAIADMVLARAEKAPERFYSLSSQIESEKKDYYLVLEASQRGDTDITHWLQWYLGCLERALASAQGELESVLAKAEVWKKISAVSINDRQRAIINRLLDGFEGKLTSTKYAKLAKCSHDTALRDIHALIEAGILVRDGAGGRSTSYSLRAIR